MGESDTLLLLLQLYTHRTQTGSDAVFWTHQRLTGPILVPLSSSTVSSTATPGLENWRSKDLEITSMRRVVRRECAALIPV